MERLKRTAEQVKQLERQIRPASQAQVRVMCPLQGPCHDGMHLLYCLTSLHGTSLQCRATRRSCPKLFVLWLQDAVQLAELASAASEQYAACMAEVDELVSCQYPEQAVPLQLRALEEQLRQRLEVRWHTGPLASSRVGHV